MAVVELERDAGRQPTSVSHNVEPERTPQQRRRRLMWLSLFALVVLPSIAAAIYYNVVASKQFAVEVRFAVRGQDNVAAPDLLGMFTGVAASGSTLTDSYILIDYIHSKEMLLRLADELDVRGMFSRERADLLASFWNEKAPIEDFLIYWRRMVNISFDSSSRIVSVQVRTFGADDSHNLSKAILRQSEKLVNELSERSRRDAVTNAQQEVSRMEDRLRQSRKELRKFRETQQDIDPSVTAQANLQRLSELQTKLNVAEAKLASQRTFMDDQAPTIAFTKSQIKALQLQLESERAKLGQGALGTPAASGTLSGIVEDYQGLQLEFEFAQKAYVSALASLERARVTADQQQRYLATFVPPRAPETAIYPMRVLNSVVFTILAFVLWAIGVLIFYAVRDHAT